MKTAKKFYFHWKSFWISGAVSFILIFLFFYFMPVPDGRLSLLDAFWMSAVVSLLPLLLIASPIAYIYGSLKKDKTLAGLSTTSKIIATLIGLILLSIPVIIDALVTAAVYIGVELLPLIWIARISAGVYIIYLLYCYFKDKRK